MDHFKLRGGVYFADSIPTGSTGKPNRNLCKDFATHRYKAGKENGKCKEIKPVSTKITQICIKCTQ